MARSTEIASIKRSLNVVAATVLTAAVLAALYWGHSLLIPSHWRCY
jgi:hypothetical protein